MPGHHVELRTWLSKSMAQGFWFSKGQDDKIIDDLSRAAAAWKFERAASNSANTRNSGSLSWGLKIRMPLAHYVDKGMDVYWFSLFVRASWTLTFWAGRMWDNSIKTIPSSTKWSDSTKNLSKEARQALGVDTKIQTSAWWGKSSNQLWECFRVGLEQFNLLRKSKTQGTSNLGHVAPNTNPSSPYGLH